MSQSKSVNYAEQRKNMRYYNVIKDMLALCADGARSIIDVGSRDTDMLSFLPVPTKVCLDKNVLPTVSPEDGLTCVQADWLTYSMPEPFDIVCCFQVLEHIADDVVRPFAQKLLASGRIVLISVPYKWPKGACHYHCQDPVDEKKLALWTGREPDMAFLIEEDNHPRMLCLYFQDKAALLAVLKALPPRYRKGR